MYEDFYRTVTGVCRRQDAKSVGASDRDPATNAFSLSLGKTNARLGAAGHLMSVSRRHRRLSAWLRKLDVLSSVRADATCGTQKKHQSDRKTKARNLGFLLSFMRQRLYGANTLF